MKNFERFDDSDDAYDTWHKEEVVPHPDAVAWTNEGKCMKMCVLFGRWLYSEAPDGAEESPKRKSMRKALADLVDGVVGADENEADLLDYRGVCAKVNAHGNCLNNAMAELGGGVEVLGGKRG